MSDQTIPRRANASSGVDTKHCSGVFIVGAPRSGTTLLALILMRLPQFAVYRAESKLLSLCQHRFGSLSSSRARSAFLKEWYESMQFTRSGLSHRDFEELLREHGGDWYHLLMAFMDAIAGKQGKTHWCDSEPHNGFYIHDILRRFPDARVIHIIRDGRSVAVSQEKLGWLSLPVHHWPRVYRLMVAGLQWERSVKAIQAAATAHPEGVFALHYEDLVTDTQGALKRLGGFLQVDTSALWQDGQNPLATVESNTAFADQTPGLSRTGIGRWRGRLDRTEEAALTSTIRRSLLWMDYEAQSVHPSIHHRVFAHLARPAIAAKRWAITSTSLGRWSTTTLPVARSPRQTNVANTPEARQENS